VVSEDTVLPLTNPVKAANGQLVSEIVLAKGTSVNIPIAYFNRAKDIWGHDAKLFKPERWLKGEEGLPEKVRQMKGYHHIFTFGEGPRLCVGRNFALANIKVGCAISKVLLCDGHLTEHPRRLLSRCSSATSPSSSQEEWRLSW